jgi:hypothetical protein
MRRVTIQAASRLFAALMLVLLLASPSARGQALPSRKDLKEWVENAQRWGRLQFADLPYHFIARVHYTLGGNAAPLEGTFEVLWAAPDRYRVEFRLGDTNETDLVLGDKKYVVRSTPNMTLAMWSVSDFLFSKFPPGGLPNPDALTDISSTGDGASRQICATVGETAAMEHHMCFDANTTELISQHSFRNPHGVMAKFPSSIDLTDYTMLGKMRFPRKLVKEYGPQKIEAALEKWETVASFGEDLFTPLPKATVWDSCVSPKIQPPARPNYRPTAPTFRDPKTGDPQLVYLAVYEVIGTDGLPKEVIELFGPPGKPAEKFVGDLHHVRSPVLLCDGKPVEYETVVLYWPLGGFFR